jgi:hypothetical protein
MEYEYTITKVYRRINGYQSETLYEIKHENFSMRIIYWGNCGFDAPQITRLSRGSTYYHALNTLLKAFYGDKIDPRAFNVREGMQHTFTLERYF